MGSKGIFTYAGIGHEKVNLPPKKINMPPESQWLEDVFSYWNSLFLGDFRSFSGVVTHSHTIHVRYIYLHLLVFWWWTMVNVGNFYQSHGCEFLSVSKQKNKKPSPQKPNKLSLTCRILLPKPVQRPLPLLMASEGVLRGSGCKCRLDVPWRKEVRSDQSLGSVGFFTTPIC